MNRSPVVRALALVGVFALAGGASVFTVQQFAAHRAGRWTREAASDFDVLVVHVLTVLLVLAISNLVLRARWRTLPLALVFAVGSAFGFLGGLSISMRGFWGAPVPWWNEPAAFLTLAAGALPGLAFGTWVRRTTPRPRVDTALAALAFLTLVAAVVPFGTWRLASMGSEERHQAAIRRFGDLYLHAKAVLDACTHLRDALPAGAELVIAPTGSRVADDRIGPGRSGVFTFEYRVPDGGDGRIEIRSYRTLRPDSGIAYRPASRLESGEYAVRLHPDDRTTSTLVGCPGLEGDRPAGG